MKTKQCANCGAPAENRIQCLYCKSIFHDETDNRLRNNSFYLGYSVSTAVCYPFPSSHPPYYYNAGNY